MNDRPTYVRIAYKINSNDGLALSKRSSHHQTAATDFNFERTTSKFGKQLGRPFSQRFGPSSAKQSFARESESQSAMKLPIRENLSSGVYRQRAPGTSNPQLDLKNDMFRDKLYRADIQRPLRNGSLHDLHSPKIVIRGRTPSQGVFSFRTLGFKQEEAFSRTETSWKPADTLNNEVYVKKLNVDFRRTPSSRKE